MSGWNAWAPTDRLAANPTCFGKTLSFPERNLHTDLFMWKADEDFRDFAMRSPVSLLARRALGASETVLLNDQLFKKGVGCALPTPWHRDAEAQHVVGDRVCGVWAPFDPVSPDGSGLKFLRGSHRWSQPKPSIATEERCDRLRAEVTELLDASPSLLEALRTAFGLVGARHEAAMTASPLPNGTVGLQTIAHHIGDFDVLAPRVEPGDVLLFDHRVIHGAGGNPGPTSRRALCTRWAADGTVYQPQLGTLPLAWEHGLRPGDELGGRLFPRAGEDGGSVGVDAGSDEPDAKVVLRGLLDLCATSVA